MDPSTRLGTSPGAAITAAGDRDTLRREGNALGRFILGRAVAPEFVERYADAHEHLPLTASTPDEEAMLAFAVAHVRLLACMDAAAALLRPHGVLHRKAILMLAILEASPAHADEFLPRPTSWGGLVAVGARAAIGSAARVAIGVPLLMLARSRR